MRRFVEAAIGHLGEPDLAFGSRALSAITSRGITDLFFLPERAYQVALVGDSEPEEYYGDLRIILDTATYGERFLKNSLVILTSGVLRALLLGLVLYLIYHALLTRPLAKIIRHFQQVNPPIGRANINCLYCLDMKKTSWVYGRVRSINC